MRPMNMNSANSKTQLLLTVLVAVTLLLTPAAFAAAPGITGPTFYLTAQQAYLNQPDGEAVYSWGYGCDPAHALPGFLPAAIAGAFCNSMQVPGPTLIVHENDVVTVNLLNGLPAAAGNTSILFPGFQVCVGTISAGVCTPSAAGTNGVTGLLTQEAAPGGTVSYQFTASSPGTHPYYSGTQGDLQIEMGLYGAVIVLPATPGGTAGCAQGVTNLYHLGDYGSTNGIAGFPENDFRLSTAAYDHPKSCYDREYLFQWAEMDTRIHRQAQTQVLARTGCTAGMPGCSLDVQTEPYHPAYFLINGRSMPDLMDPNYASEYPHQPYNGNPHIHPGELLLIRTIGQGRWQHPFHEHANHVRILARDGNLELSPTNPTTSLSGLLMFNTDTTPGESFDGIFYFTGRGLNWDPYGHHPGPDTGTGQALPVAIAGTSELGTTVTVTSNLAPLVGDKVSITGFTGATAGYNGSFTVLSSAPGSFTYTDTVSGLAATAGRGFAQDLSASATTATNDPLAHLGCTPDANGYNTGNKAALNYYEWCQDHNKPVQVNPFGDVPAGGPATFPDPNVFTNGPWYSGTPYFGPDANLRAAMPACAQSTGSTNGTGTSTAPLSNCTNLQPSNVQTNPANERGWAFMWHSHNEREITTNNVFPGGMLMMLLVDSREFAIDESQ